MIIRNCIITKTSSVTPQPHTLENQNSGFSRSSIHPIYDIGNADSNVIRIVDSSYSLFDKFPKTLINHFAFRRYHAQIHI